MHVVTPLLDPDTRWFTHPQVGVISFKKLKHMSYNASVPNNMYSSAFSPSRGKLQDSVIQLSNQCQTPSVRDGREGHNCDHDALRAALRKKEFPRSEPVRPPRNWHDWKPCKQSQPSASFLTTSNQESIRLETSTRGPFYIMFPLPTCATTM